MNLNKLQVLPTNIVIAQSELFAQRTPKIFSVSKSVQEKSESIEFISRQYQFITPILYSDQNNSAVCNAEDDKYAIVLLLYDIISKIETESPKTSVDDVYYLNKLNSISLPCRFDVSHKNTNERLKRAYLAAECAYVVNKKQYEAMCLEKDIGRFQWKLKSLQDERDEPMYLGMRALLSKNIRDLIT